MKRKVMLMATAVAMVALMVVGATLAFFTDTDELTNVITVGDIDIDLYEDTGVNNNEQEGREYDLMPGYLCKQIKDAYVKNIGPNDAYLRVIVNFKGLPEEFDGSKLLESNWKKGWIVDKKHSTDDMIIIYYLNIFKLFRFTAGEDDLVFTGNIDSVLKSNWELFRGCNIEWSIKAQAIQADNNWFPNFGNTSSKSLAASDDVSEEEQEAALTDLHNVFEKNFAEE